MDVIDSKSPSEAPTHPPMTHDTAGLPCCSTACIIWVLCDASCTQPFSERIRELE